MKNFQIMLYSIIILGLYFGLLYFSLVSGDNVAWSIFVGLTVTFLPGVLIIAICDEINKRYKITRNITKTELEIYKKALSDYRRAFFNPLIRKSLYVNLGFCNYFNTNIKENLPYLYKQKPQIMFKGTNYWWKPGALRPRIKALKLAIDEIRRNNTKS